MDYLLGGSCFLRFFALLTGSYLSLMSVDGASGAWNGDGGPGSSEKVSKVERTEASRWGRMIGLSRREGLCERNMVPTLGTSRKEGIPNIK